AVLLLDRPEQPARLVEVRVVWPAVQWREALLARARAAAAIGNAVRARAVPRHADHQPAVVAEVGRPPVLRVPHQRLQVLDDRIQVEAFEFLGVIEVPAHWIGLRGVSMERVEVQLARPPVAVPASAAAACEGALARIRVVSIYVHHNLLWRSVALVATIYP